jgi:hypothetical protein
MEYRDLNHRARFRAEPSDQTTHRHISIRRASPTVWYFSFKIGGPACILPCGAS